MTPSSFRVERVLDQLTDPFLRVGLDVDEANRDVIGRHVDHLDPYDLAANVDGMAFDLEEDLDLLTELDGDRSFEPGTAERDARDRQRDSGVVPREDDGRRCCRDTPILAAFVGVARLCHVAIVRPRLSGEG